MIFKRRFGATLLVLLCGAFAATESSDDFKFDSDDLQIVYSDPPEAVMKPPSRYIYAKEIAQCPTGESKMMLTLLLHSLRWSDVSERKREKAIKKLSRFFLVPRQFITVGDIHTPEILEMLKHSINKSNNLLNAKDSVGRVEFMIGCGDKLFENGRIIAHQIHEVVKTGALDELSGLPINWWNIWSKHVKSRVQRTRRQADGSGNDEDEFGDDNYYDEDEDSDNNDNEDTTDPPRVRHNQRKKNKNKSKKNFAPQVQDEPSVQTEEAEREMIPEEIPETPVEIPEAPEIPFIEIDPVTQRNAAVDGPMTPIDVIENIKLESYVNKTIVNDNNVVDVPVFQEKDKMLEEVRKMISEPQPELTTVMYSFVETTTREHIPETTTESPTTVQVEELMITTTTTIVPVTTTPAPEVETIFVPIIANNNENINIYDEKLSIVATTESSPTPEDDVTERTSTQATHETTHIPITTSTEILTTSDPSTTTTLRIVDATLAVDKVLPSNEVGKATVKPQPEKKPDEESESNYDDEYDDSLPEEVVNSVDVESNPSPTQAPATSTTLRVTSRTTTQEVFTLPTVPSTTEQEEETASSSAAPTTVETSTEVPSAPATTEEAVDSFDNEEVNIRPRVDKRLPRVGVTAGKPFVIKVEENVFYDEEDKTNLKLTLLDKNGAPIPSTSWIRFDPAKREIYGLPLEADVSQHEFKLRATDTDGDWIDEKVDITIQQHKRLRSTNHEIFIQVKLEKHYESPVDWQIRLIRGIVEALGDESIVNIAVREVRPNKYESNMFTFVYANESLTIDHCPKDELNHLMDRLTKQALNEAMKREIIVRNVEKDLAGSCADRTTPKPHPTPTNTRNFPPTVRNPVDRISAYLGQLLVYEVPKDTFYDPEDFTELKLTLVKGDRSKIEPNHWLQFDAKNREFYGVPSIHDKTQQYILVAEDKNGLFTNDALQVDVFQGNFKRDHSATFEYQLDIGNEQFQNAATKRKFIEGVARVFGDSDTDHILMKIVKKLQYAGRTSVILQNSTLYHGNRECPTAEIDKLRNILINQDRSVRSEVKETIGNDFNVLKITVAPTGKCAGGDSFHHPPEEVTPRPDEEGPIINQEVLITYVLPTAIILLMLLIALLIACLLYKRRNTGKMELGDEEERKSFRSKGIPVIFQDELEEKPEIVTKSPIIMKDEKPPLLPQYNGLNQDGDEDNMDQYIPPQPLLMGSRESRGKSPVTPSYRKPPPYVSP